MPDFNNPFAAPVMTPGGGTTGAPLQAPPQGPMSNPANTSPGANLLRILSLASGLHPQGIGMVPGVPGSVAVNPAPAPVSMPPTPAPVVAPAPAPVAVATPNARPDFSSYIPQGLAMALSRLASTGMLDHILGNSQGFTNMLSRFGLTPDQVQAQGFDPSQLYTRQMARADYRAGNTPAAPGMIPNGWTAPISARAAKPIGMISGQHQQGQSTGPAPTGLMPTNPNQPLGTPQGY